MHADTRVAIARVASLKACAKQKDLYQGINIHADIARRNLLTTNSFIGSTLISMYSKCGALAKAQEVFDNLWIRNIVSWNALIAGYVQHGYGEEALKLFERMRLGGLSPDTITFVCILKACGSVGAIDKGQEVHLQAEKDGFLDKDINVGNTLLDMYVKCGLLSKAQEVFDKLLLRNVVSWNALIAGHVQHWCGEEAWKCFDRMQLEGFSPDVYTFACILKACGILRASKKGQRIHTQIVLEVLSKEAIVVANALVDMYAKCGLLDKSQEVFEELPVWDVVSWNSLIAGHAEHMHSEEALGYFVRMQIKGFSPDAVSFACVLKACGSTGAAHKGEEVHSKIVQEGLFDKNIVVLNALVDFYAKCNLLEEALEVFDKLPIRDVVSWSSLIAGYAQHMYGEEALSCYQQMQFEGFPPDPVTYACVLKPCGSVGTVGKGQEIHAEIVIQGLLEKNNVVANALIDMYGKCGMLAEAQQVFVGLEFRDEVSWNALIAGYAQQMLNEEALSCFECMQHEGFSANVATFVCILKACGSIGAAFKGIGLHAEIMRCGTLVKDMVIGTALVDMYANCGMLAQAQEVFGELLVRDVVSWNALIAGYAERGKDTFVFDLLDKMIGEGKEPNTITFTIIINACSHRGLLDEALMCFDCMCEGYGIIPTLEHHTCMVDLFGRAGQLDKAAAVIKEMAYSTNLLVWHSVLGACQKWGDPKLGRWAFDHAAQLDEKDASVYICMSNIYAAAGWQGGVNLSE